MGALLLWSATGGGCVGDRVELGASAVGTDAADPDGAALDVGAESSTEASGEAAIQTCNTNSDCTWPALCGFPTSARCEATGQCIVPSNAGLGPCASEMAETACTCTGVTLDWSGGCAGLPIGYAPSPVASLGACEGGTFGADASASHGDAGL